MNRWQKLLLLCMTTLMMVTTSVPAFAAPTAPVIQSKLPQQEGFHDFVRCIIDTHKYTVPEAKKLTPQGYQDFEQALNTSFKATAILDLQPHLAALRTGAQIGKFIGYDMVWFIGTVQYCWYNLEQ